MFGRHLCNCPYRPAVREECSICKVIKKETVSGESESSDSSDSSDEEYDRIDRNFRKGISYMEKGKFGRACKKLAKAYKNSSNNSHYKSKLDEAKRMKEKIKQAKIDFNEGKRCFYTNDFENARCYFARAYDLCSPLYSKRKDYLTWKNRASDKIEETKNSRAELIFNEGMLQFIKEDYESAKLKFEQALQGCSLFYRNRSIFSKHLENCINKIEERKRFQAEEERRIKAEQDALRSNDGLKSLNNRCLLLYHENLAKEITNKYVSLINKFYEANMKLEKSYSKEELDEVFDSFLLLIEEFMKCGAYQNVIEIINFIYNRFDSKRALIKELREKVDSVFMRRESCNHLSDFINQKRIELQMQSISQLRL